MSSQANPYDHTGGAITFSKGEKQPTKCRDPIFAGLFYVNLAVIVALASFFGPDAFEDALGSNSTSTDTDTNNDASDANDSSADDDLSFDDYSPFLYGALITGVFSLIASFVMLSVLMCIPTLLIKVSLIFSVVMAGVWAVAALLAGSLAVAIIGLLFFAIMCCYACAVWSRIPFASVNLVTGVTAIRANLGVTIVGYAVVILAFGWSLLWVVALLGVLDQVETCETVTNANGEEVEECTASLNYGIMFLLFISYFFVHQVLQNTVVVVVAGTVGTWWFSPSEVGCCAASVTGSLCRAVTTSFGSICFGSLIVAVIQALRQLANAARNNDDANPIIICIVDCILSCIESLIEYFNKWAYIYVGLYGYSYLEAGKNVFQLFRDRGWEAIIADNLVGNTLFFVSIVVGGLSGAFGVALATTDLYEDIDDSEARIGGFLFGFIIGAVLTSILMSVIGSAVNAVIVLFAEAPAEFQRNYPDLSEKMRSIWAATFPGCL